MKAIRLVLVHGYSGCDVGRMIGCSPATVQSWVRQFKSSGASLPYIPFNENDLKYRSYPKKKQQECIDAVIRHGQSCEEAAKILGCHPVSVRRWVEKERVRLGKISKERTGTAADSAATESAEPERIRTKNGLIEACRKITGASSDEKCGFVMRYVGRFPVKMMCENLGLEEETYLRWLKTAAAQHRKKPKQSLLSRLVNTVSKQHRGKIGYRKIHKILKEKGFVYTQHQVMCACQEAGIADVRYSKETP